MRDERSIGSGADIVAGGLLRSATPRLESDDWRVIDERRRQAVARPGDRVSVADFVDWIEFREIDDGVLAYEISFRPRAILTREHIHSRQEERHEVLSGQMLLKV